VPQAHDRALHTVTHTGGDHVNHPMPPCRRLRTCPWCRFITAPLTATAMAVGPRHCKVRCSLAGLSETGLSGTPVVAGLALLVTPGGGGGGIGGVWLLNSSIFTLFWKVYLREARGESASLIEATQNDGLSNRRWVAVCHK